ncbi:MAG: hypothetical protein HC855_03130 [Rhizobiales bacterium]|nr:hypothetical protein [Hyphomicrobiales bacterium]
MAEARGNHSRSSRFAATKRWLLSITATIASTYALDAIAAAAGLLLAASQLMQGLSHMSVLAFLAGTYILWGMGLRLNLEANWRLLEETGTSTNVLSKVAFDVVRHWTGNVRMRKIATASGYAGTELAKEAPYYAGAFGAALFSDSVSANDALTFLGGANLGAAIYEYGLARLVTGYLQRKNTPIYACFETDWLPRDYLRDFYSVIEEDERRTIAFFVEALKKTEPNRPILFFGVGPALHHVFLAARRASEIHLGDYLPANLREIERWIERDPRAHDWRPFVRFTLECEGVASPTELDITRREELTRAKITRLFEVDLRRADPLGGEALSGYSTVISAYCADSATANRGVWKTYMGRIAGLVRPDGTLLTAALRRSRFYLVGGLAFPSANIDEHDLHDVLQRHFQHGGLEIASCELENAASKGYSSIVLARASGRCASA